MAHRVIDHLFNEKSILQISKSVRSAHDADSFIIMAYKKSQLYKFVMKSMYCTVQS